MYVRTMNDNGFARRGQDRPGESFMSSSITAEGYFYIHLTSIMSFRLICATRPILIIMALRCVDEI